MTSPKGKQTFELCTTFVRTNFPLGEKRNLKECIRGRCVSLYSAEKRRQIRIEREERRHTVCVASVAKVGVVAPGPYFFFFPGGKDH